MQISKIDPYFLEFNISDIFGDCWDDPQIPKTIIMEAGQQLDLSRENVSYAVTEV